MNKFFYAKLALTNINKNRKTYIPYILTSIGTIAMFYIMHFIAWNPGLLEMSGGQSLKSMLIFGTYIIGLFSIIFLFYTNSFLIKQRKKEFGLFNILGMEKKHIARVMLWETIFTAFVSLVTGLVSGVVISRLMFMILENMLRFQVPLAYIISTNSIAKSIVLFAGIFLLSFLNNLRHIHLAKPIELLKGGQVGEREPKTRWILALIGALSLGSGYYIALVTETPLAALNKFFLAVLLVIIGTYALFTAGTIAILKLMRKNKKFYYQTKNFINVSGMIYRMKKNAVGLANISILSTMVLVTLSTTVSMYIGMEDLLRNRFPNDISVNVRNVPAKDVPSAVQLIEQEAEKHEINMEDPIQYRYESLGTIKNGNTFSIIQPESGPITDISIIGLMPLEDYNQLAERSVSLQDDEVLLFTYRGEPVHDTLTIIDRKFHIKEQLKDLPKSGEASAMATNTYFVVVKDDEIIKELYTTGVTNLGEWKDLSFYYGFDTSGDAEKEIALTKALSKRLEELSFKGSAEGLEESRESFYSLYGGLLFLGIFLGALFLMATVLIIYYKQISEGYEDKKRFDIMQKVGLSKDEIKTSIRGQVLMVFFLPLATAVIHIAFAFKVITKLLELFNLTDIGLFVLCTAGTISVFAVFYVLIYTVTARVYYKIVS